MGTLSCADHCLSSVISVYYLIQYQPQLTSSRLSCLSLLSFNTSLNSCIVCCHICLLSHLIPLSTHVLYSVISVYYFIQSQPQLMSCILSYLSIISFNTSLNSCLVFCHICLLFHSIPTSTHVLYSVISVYYLI